MLSSYLHTHIIRYSQSVDNRFLVCNLPNYLLIFGPGVCHLLHEGQPGHGTMWSAITAQQQLSPETPHPSQISPDTGTRYRHPVQREVWRVEDSVQWIIHHQSVPIIGVFMLHRVCWGQEDRNITAIDTLLSTSIYMLLIAKLHGHGSLMWYILHPLCHRSI